MSDDEFEATTVREAWLAFEEAAIPKDAGPNQRKAMEMGFYGGALAMFNLLAVASSQDSGEPTDREVDAVSTLYDELDKWGDEQTAARLWSAP